MTPLSWINTTMNNDLLTRKELAGKLQVKPSTIQQWQRKGLPVERFGHKTVRYDLNKIRIWITKKEGGDTHE